LDRHTKTTDTDAPVADRSPSSIQALQPFDEHNQTLAKRVHPADWQNPVSKDRYNLVVIGAGAAGLVTAAGAAGLGARVALIERDLLGGDCLNSGCVPSKALIRSAKAVADVRSASALGIQLQGGIKVDFPAVMERMRRIRAAMSIHDSVARFSEMGIDIYLGEARFADEHSVLVGGQTLHFAKAVIATGTRPKALPIEGLDESGYLSNESLFSLTTLPERLAIIGAGPVGCEMAQTFARLGSTVSLIEAAENILPKKDPDGVKIVARSMEQDGVTIHCQAQILSVSKTGDTKVIRLKGEHEVQELQVDAILVAAGRTPNVDTVNLEAAGVAYSLQHGVTVNDYLQSNVAHIYAAGDVASPCQFTHVADAMARIVIQNALFFGRARFSALTIPWAIYTDPEFAQVGLSAEDLTAKNIAFDTICVEMKDVDRAILDGDEEGFVRVHLKKGSDKILGATIVARHAGDMISEISTLMNAGKGLACLARTIHPYPTQAEALKKVADAYSRTRLTPKVRALFKLLLRWRR